jgi:histone-lysine N-methyltransferase SETMAR
LQDNSFESIPSGDESRFLYEYQPNSIFTASRETVAPRYDHEIQAKKKLITVFFTPTRLLVLAALPYGQTFTQNHFITEVLPILREENVQFRRKHSGDYYFVHMDNSRCHNRKKNTAEIEHRRLAGAPPPPYSPDHSPCDFWLFGLMKHNLKDREIRAVQTLITALSKIWNDLHFEDVQAVFLDWMERLSWVIDNNGQYYIQYNNIIILIIYYIFNQTI